MGRCCRSCWVSPREGGRWATPCSTWRHRSAVREPWARALRSQVANPRALSFGWAPGLLSWVPVRVAWRTQCPLAHWGNLSPNGPSQPWWGADLLTLCSHSLPLSDPQTRAILRRGLPADQLKGPSFQGGQHWGRGRVLLRRHVLGVGVGSESSTWDLGGASGGRDTEGQQTDGEGLTPDPQDAASAAAPVAGLAQPLRPSSSPVPAAGLCTRHGSTYRRCDLGGARDGEGPCHVPGSEDVGLSLFGQSLGST